MRQVATLVAYESSPDRLVAVVAEQVARVFDVPLVRLIRYEPATGWLPPQFFIDRSGGTFPRLVLLRTEGGKALLQSRLTGYNPPGVLLWYY